MRLIRQWLRRVRSKPAAVYDPTRATRVLLPRQRYEVLCDRSLERAS